FFSSRRRHTRSKRDWSSDVCSSDLITRLLDRLEKQGWITRERQKDDRRVVKARMTARGLELLKPLDQPMRNLHKRQFRHMAGGRLKALYDLLEQIRPAKRE